MKEQYRVVSSSPLWVRKAASSTAKPVALVYPNEMIEVVNKQDGFLRIANGWVSEYSTDKSTRLVAKMDADEIATFAGPQPREDARDTQYSTGKTEVGTKTGPEVFDEVNRGGFSEVYTGGTLKFNTTASNIDTLGNQYRQALSNINIQDLNGIMGMPYQFMPHVDPRLRNNKGSTEGAEFGRVYGERIVARMPLLIIAPGEPEFLAGYTETEKRNVAQAIIGETGDFLKDISGGQSALDKLLGDEGKYYSFRYAGNRYFQFLNPMLNTAAILLDIGDVAYGGTTLDQYNWQKNYNASIYNYWTGKRALAFYIDSDNQISDSFTNEDTTSALASKVNDFSDMAREVGFLLGGASAATSLRLDALSGTNAISDSYELGNFVSDAVSAQGAMRQFLNQVVGGFKTVLAGGKLIFPNIWSDSSFSRPYDIQFKFVSPDYDRVSWYLNILVPICHLLCLTIPRSTGPNGFVSPFLVRAYYKGLFNCDMGLVTNLSISKGSEGGWTRDGLPTTVNVNMSIKDLYGAISITETNGVTQNILKNSLFMDYLANLCGININEPDLGRTIELYYKIGFRNRITQWSYNVYGAATDTVMRWITDTFGGLFRHL